MISDCQFSFGQLNWNFLSAACGCGIIPGFTEPTELKLALNEQSNESGQRNIFTIPLKFFIGLLIQPNVDGSLVSRHASPQVEVVLTSN